jgi:prepilin-type N-terminal cleavage/methylation domain-containing protein
MNTRRKTTRRTGFTLAELMVATVVSAMVLAAIGTGVHVAIDAYTFHDSTASVNQTLRVLQQRLRTEIGNAQTVQLLNVENRFEIVFPATDPNRRVVYQIAEGTLYITRYTSGGVPLGASIGPAQGITFEGLKADLVTGLVYDGSQFVTEVKRVTISLDIICDGVSRTMTVSTSLRRNM